MQLNFLIKKQSHSFLKTLKIITELTYILNLHLSHFLKQEI